MTPLQVKASRIFDEVPAKVGGVDRILHKAAGDAVTDLLVVMSGRVKTHRGKFGEVRVNLAAGVLVDCGVLTRERARELTGKDFAPRQLSLI